MVQARPRRVPQRLRGVDVQQIKNIAVWRWLLFAAMIVPAFYVAVLAVKAMLWVLEDKIFLTSNIVFHIIAVRVGAHLGRLWRKGNPKTQSAVHSGSAACAYF